MNDEELTVAPFMSHEVTKRILNLEKENSLLRNDLDDLIARFNDWTGTTS